MQCCHDIVDSECCLVTLSFAWHVDAWTISGSSLTPMMVVVRFSDELMQVQTRIIQ